MSTMQVLGIGIRAARAANRQRRAERQAHLAGRTAASRVGTLVAEHGLSVAGFGCLVAAATIVALPLGLAVAGVAMFLLELRASS